MTGVKVFTADQITAAALILPAAVPLVVEQLGWADELRPVTTWQQLPTVRALQSANTPAGAIASPGLVTPPTRDRDGVWQATWRLVVAVYDRAAVARGTTGDEAGYASTMRRVQRWGGVLRAAILLDPTLGGVVGSTTWVGEDFADNVDDRNVRTLGCAAVSFDVTVPAVFDLNAGGPGQLDPLVTSTHTRVTVRQRTP